MGLSRPVAGKLYLYLIYFERGSRNGVVGIAAGRSGDRIPVGARFSVPIETGSEAHPAHYTMGSGCFPGVKAAGV